MLQEGCRDRTHIAPETTGLGPAQHPLADCSATRDASAQLADLLRLARIEMRGNVRAVATLALLFGGAALLILVSLVLLLLSVRDAIACWSDPMRSPH